MMVISKGPSLAFASAVLFGASTPFAKELLGAIDPALLAALLYLGSGIGLGVVRTARSLRHRRQQTSERLGMRGVVWLAGAVLFGGVLGPLLLMFGLTLTLASSASLLLNL